MTSNLLGTTVEEVLDGVLDDGPTILYVVSPSALVLDRLVNAAVAVEDALPTIRVLGDQEILKEVMDDFIVASTAADLIEGDVLEVRTMAGGMNCSTLVTDARVVTLVEVNGDVGGLTTTDDEFTDTAFDMVADDWPDAEAFNLRTPAISRVTETLESDISEEARMDFEAMLDSLETATGNDDGLDEVTISLLVAARNRILLYDISKWGEDVGIASKATFSRTKTLLEDVGLIETEKVPIDVGRPRLRLRLAEDVADEEMADLVSKARTALAS